MSLTSEEDFISVESDDALYDVLKVVLEHADTHREAVALMESCKEYTRQFTHGEIDKQGAVEEIDNHNLSVLQDEVNPSV